MKKLILTALVLASVVAAEDLAAGKKMFVEYTCYGCHGYSGQNGPGNRLVPMKLTQQGFTNYLRNPPRPQQMPSYSAKVLSDAQVGDIYAYIKTLPDAPKAADIKVLQDIKAEMK